MTHTALTIKATLVVHPVCYMSNSMIMYLLLSLLKLRLKKDSLALQARYSQNCKASPIFIRIPYSDEGRPTRGGDESQTDEEPYFKSYSQLYVHEMMIKDEKRTDAYMNAIKQNRHLFKGKTVLDVGAGSGILSIFAVKYGGAKHVYAVEMSAMATLANQLIRDNGLESKVIVI